MEKNKKKEDIKEQPPKKDVATEIAEKEEQIKKLKAEKKELEEKYTFKGLYTKLAGRKNILTELRDDKESKDSEKVNKAIELLNEFIAEYE